MAPARRPLVGLLLAAAAARVAPRPASSPAAPAAPAGRERPPHLVFLLADDVGLGDVGFFGPGSGVLSPALDALAAEGVRLGRHYSYSWCAPSRAALLTGRYPVYTGVYNYSGANYALGTEFRLLPQMLKHAGYATHAVGKWHLGMYEERFLPERRGFDSFFGFLNGGEDHYQHSGSGPGPCFYKDLWDSAAGGPARAAEYFPQYSAYMYGNRAVEIVEGHDPSTPLFLYLAFQSAHSPLQVPREFFSRYPGSEDCEWAAFRQGTGFRCTGPQGLYCRCNRLVVAAMVTALDEAVGNLTEALRKRGMWDDTVVVFSSDNGGPQMLAHWNSGLRGGKWTFFEGGVRVPAFVRAPRRLLPAAARGAWYNGTVHLTDWLPTLLGLAGVGGASSNGAAGAPETDGFDQWSAIAHAGDERSTSRSPRNHTLITKGILLAGDFKLITIPPAGFGECGVMKRQGWDCVLGTGGGWMSLPAGDENECPSVDCGQVVAGVDRWLCSGACSRERPCLFDVARDPGERRNLAGELPDVVRELLAVLAGFDARAVPPYTKVADTNHTMCEAFMQRWGGYFGPWLQQAPDAARLLVV